MAQDAAPVAHGLRHHGPRRHSARHGAGAGARVPPPRRPALVGCRRLRARGQSFRPGSPGPHLAQQRLAPAGVEPGFRRCGHHAAERRRRGWGRRPRRRADLPEHRSEPEHPGRLRKRRHHGECKRDRGLLGPSRTPGPDAAREGRRRDDPPGTADPGRADVRSRLGRRHPERRLPQPHLRHRQRSPALRGDHGCRTALVAHRPSATLPFSICVVGWSDSDAREKERRHP